MIDFKVDIKFSFSIILAFVIFTVVGTLTHELGHIAVAKYFGYDTLLHYGSMNHFSKDYDSDEEVKKLRTIFEDHKTIINKEGKEGVTTTLDSLNKANDGLIKSVEEKYSKNKNDSLFIVIGGPAQTILTSVLGLMILGYRKSKLKINFKLLDWLVVFLGLFILREIFNFVFGIVKFVLFAQTNFYGDEFRISRYLGFNEWIIPSVAFVLGLAVSLYIIFKVIPIKYRFSFIISGLIGGILGFAIWFGFLGELLIP